MKQLQDICWAIEWCSQCTGLDPCRTDTGEVLPVPDHIPDDQILKYLKIKELV